MTHSIWRNFTVTTLCGALAFAPVISYAGALQPEEFESFESSEPVADEELAEMRGGFITLSGLTIDFAINTVAVIDGVTQRDLTIDSGNLDALNPEDLRQVIQVGQGNSAALDQLANLPGVATVIQNTQDGTLIQNFTTLDIVVSNVQTFQNQSQVLPELEIQNITGIR